MKLFQLKMNDRRCESINFVVLAENEGEARNLAKATACERIKYNPDYGENHKGRVNKVHNFLREMWGSSEYSSCQELDLNTAGVIAAISKCANCGA